MLIKLLSNPFEDERSMMEWGFHHRNHHLDIMQKIQDKTKILLTDYIIYPFYNIDLQGWLIRHQSMHNAMNGLLGYVGEDLNRVDFTDASQRDFWVNQNYNEHLSAEVALGI